MKTLILRRVTTSNKGTKGVLVFNNDPFSVTLELPWLDNEPYVSCIPAGEYICKRVNSPKFNDTFEVTNVPNRTHVLFHKANRLRDLLGCIGVAEKFGYIGGESGVLESKHGYNEFMNLMSDTDEFRLIIVDDWKTNLLE